MRRTCTRSTFTRFHCVLTNCIVKDAFIPGLGFFETTQARLCTTKSDHPTFTAKEKFLPRRKEVEEIVEYCCKTAGGMSTFPEGSFERQEGKFRLCGTTGTMGIGKTELLLQARKRLESSDNIVPIYMTFNESMALAGHFNSLVENREKSNSEVLLKAFFSCVLLAIDPANTFHKPKVEPGPQDPPLGLCDFDTTLGRIRAALNIDINKTIVLLVDEVGNLDSSIVLPTLKAVMDKLDRLDGKIVAVFTHLVEDALKSTAKLSGRQPKVIPLPLLPLNTWEKLDDDIVQLARENKAVHQICLSCAGHPRSLFDGIPTEIKNFPPSTRSTKKVDKLRAAVIDRVKFNSGDDHQMKAAVEAHLKIDKRVEDSEEYPNWIRDGVVLEVNKTLSFPFPLRVQKWAEDKRNRIDLARYLNDLFDADAELTEEYEKKMEDIMFNYEAAIREVNKGWEGSLKDYFFGTAFMDPRLRTQRVGLPSAPSIEYVRNFSDGDLVVQHLEAGAMVVSESRTEDGIEYMVPFFRKVKEKDGSGKVIVVEKLFVGLVQCKFTNQSKPPTPWTAIKKGIHQSQGARVLSEQDVDFFPIIYTTVDTEEVAAGTCEGAVVFNASNLFEFTNTLGVLRLHTEKLESVLKKKYPLLDSQGSEEQKEN